MSDKMLYLPKVLFQSRPEAVAAISDPAPGKGINGECLIYPFRLGSIVITAVNGLPGGFFRLCLSSDSNTSLELPSLLSAHHFAYSLIYDGRIVPQGVDGAILSILDANNAPIASGTIRLRSDDSARFISDPT